MTNYAGPMKPRDLAAGQPPPADESDGQEARRRRDRELSMSERLERVHHLCAQLARLQPTRVKRSS